MPLHWFRVKTGQSVRPQYQLRDFVLPGGTFSFFCVCSKGSFVASGGRFRDSRGSQRFRIELSDAEAENPVEEKENTVSRSAGKSLTCPRIAFAPCQ
jgi:hypothetical protein